MFVVIPKVGITDKCHVHAISASQFMNYIIQRRLCQYLPIADLVGSPPMPCVEHQHISSSPPPFQLVHFIKLDDVSGLIRSLLPIHQIRRSVELNSKVVILIHFIQQHS